MYSIALMPPHGAFEPKATSSRGRFGTAPGLRGALPPAWSAGEVSSDGWAGACASLQSMLAAAPQPGFVLNPSHSGH